MVRPSVPHEVDGGRAVCGPARGRRHFAAGNDPRRRVVVPHVEGRRAAGAGIRRRNEDVLAHHRRVPDADVPRGEPIETAQVLVSPSSYLPYTSVIARTVENLLLHDRAYWLVVERTWDGFPREVQVMDVEDVSDLTTHSTANQNTQFPPVDPFYYIGTAVPARDVIKFYGDGLGGWLTTGAAAINTAAALEAATLNYSEYPMPTVVLKNTGADLPAATVDALLTAWEEARSNRATAYLNSAIEAKGMGWSARDLALVEARNESAIGIARIANLDPVWVGASVSGTSLTYSNRVDLFRQLLDISLRPVMDMITHRLSMPDVTPRGHAVRFDTSGFLRGNAADLGNLVAQLVPLGILTPDEARMVIDLNTLGLTPTSLVEMGSS
jgi:hypothetical protein